MHTILVVDDHADNRDLLFQMLHLNGYAVITAANGREALSMAQEYRPDLILMDLSMPVMDGWAATAALKQLPHLAHIPVIAVTGHGTVESLRRAMAAGCRDYLEKPVDYERLVRLVASFLPQSLALNAR